jgi:hypothetical protein
VAVYFSYWRTQQLRIQSQSWESLMASLEALAHDASSSRNALWTMYRRGGILLRIAEYADYHRAPVDPAVLDQLRSDALCLRVTALLFLVRLFPLPRR